MPLQTTLAEPVSITGIGLHSGVRSHVRLLPAPENSGPVFIRTDLPGCPKVPARLEFVVQTSFATTLAKGDARVGTVEHLLAALHALMLDNVHIEIDGPEVPALDGSSAPWLDLLDGAGRSELSTSRRPLKPSRSIEIRDGPRLMSIEPADGLYLDVEVDYPHPLVGRQQLSLQFTDDTFRQKLAWARTFGFASEVDALRSQGLILGGSLENAVVYDSERVLNEGGLRAPDEVVRHKTLDIIGDLFLLGHTLNARVRAVRPGHTLTFALLEALTADPTNLQETC